MNILIYKPVWLMLIIFQQIPNYNWYHKLIFVTISILFHQWNCLFFIGLEKDTVERTILTLKSLYPLTCDTDEKKRTYISAKMPLNIPNTVCYDWFDWFSEIIFDLVKCYWWSFTDYWRTMSSFIVWIWFSCRKCSCFTSLWSVRFQFKIIRESVCFFSNALMIVHPFTFRYEKRFVFLHT